MQYYTDKDEKDVETSIKSGFIFFRVFQFYSGFLISIKSVVTAYIPVSITHSNSNCFKCSIAKNQTKISRFRFRLGH